MKAENWNKRTKRKEIQFSDEEYIAVEQKASAARIPVAAYIRQAALDKNLSAALSIEELEIMKRISAISYKMQVNLNQLAKLANTCGLPFVIDAIREYIIRTNEYFRTGVWREMDLRAYEAEQKQRDNLADKVRDLQERNDNLMRVSSTSRSISSRVGSSTILAWAFWASTSSHLGAGRAEFASMTALNLSLERLPSLMATTSPAFTR